MDKARISNIIHYYANDDGLDMVRNCLTDGKASPAMELIQAGLARQIFDIVNLQKPSSGTVSFQDYLLYGKIDSLENAKIILDAWLNNLRQKEREAFFGARRPSEKSFGVLVLEKLETNDSLSYIIDVAKEHGILIRNFDASGAAVSQILKFKWLKGLDRMLDQGAYIDCGTQSRSILYTNNNAPEMLEKRRLLVLMLLERGMTPQSFRMSPAWKNIERSGPDLEAVLKAHEARQAINDVEKGLAKPTPL